VQWADISADDTDEEPLRDLHSLTFEDDLHLDGLHGLPECLEGSSA
jgi:hypothetical protein